MTNKSENLLIKCTRRQSMKAEIARLQEQVKAIDEEIKGMLTEEKTIVKPFTIWFKPNTLKHGFNQKLAKSMLTEEELIQCTTDIIYDYFDIK